MTKKNQVVMVYMTARSEKEARKIGEAVVGERLAACVNIIPGMQSLYWWNGRVQDDSEVVVIAKTRPDLVDALIDKVKSLHSYDVPCIVTLPILSGNPAYLKWVADETKK
jgi:periplasmic divalent cation tolerance protein